MEPAIDLAALDGRGASVPRPRDVADPLRGERRTVLVALVATPLVALVGVVLLVADVEGTSQVATLLALCGLVTPAFAVQHWQISSRSASRIRAFAAANGLRFEELVDSPGHAGSTFAVGASQQRLMMVRGRMLGHVVEVGNLRYRVGPRRAPLIAPGYVAIGLRARLPHVVATTRPVLRMQVGLHPRAEDRLVLPGDGGRLRVFARAETQHLVRTLLSGEMLAVVERLGDRYDVEIVDDTLFLHTRRPMSTGSARRWRTVLADVADVCSALDASRIWSQLEHQPARTLQSMTRLESGLDERRVRRIVWLSFGALLVVVSALVAWWVQSR